MEMKAESIDKHLREKSKNPHFKILYELDQQKLEISKRIIDYRIKNRVSQRQLADTAGVTQQQISKIESGEFSSITTLQKILLCIGYRVKMQAVPLRV